jgi:hypothetical protein
MEGSATRRHRLDAHIASPAATPASRHGTTEVLRPAAPPPCLPMGARRPRPSGSGLRATGHSPTVPGAHKGAQVAQPWVLADFKSSNTRIGLCFAVECRTSQQGSAGWSRRGRPRGPCADRVERQQPQVAVRLCGKFTGCSFSIHPGPAGPAGGLARAWGCRARQSHQGGGGAQASTHYHHGYTERQQNGAADQAHNDDWDVLAANHIHQPSIRHP